MRTVICCLSVFMATLFVGCGQTGALQLPNDPNFDKRSQYMIYKGTQTNDHSQKITENKADSQAASSEATQQN